MAAQTRKPPTPISISADEAAALLLQSQGLLDSPSRRATRSSLHGAIRRLGYVQIDSINVVARAHDLILRARFENYRPEQLSRLVSKDRVLFENWVHDAAMIPVDFASQWRHIQRVYAKARRERMAGRSGTRQFGRLCNQVRRRIEEEGPLMSSDFEDPRAKSGTWWSWKPAKVALEYLWRTGELVICERENFHKRYELTERFLPDLCMAKPATRRQFVDWACSSALERLGTATNRDLSDYWGHLSAADASAWCARAIARGDAVPVEIASKGPGRPRQAVAVTGWRERLNRVPESPAGVRLLAPFDPVIRDRTRLKHLFDFDYRFEAFVPAAKRRHGYYTMPLWRGTRAIGRFNPKLDRAADTLQVRGLCLEPDVRPTKRLNGEIDEALDGFREWLGAKHLMIEK